MFDANQFGAMMLQSMNPQNRLMQTFADAQLKQQEDDLMLRKSDAIDRVAANLEKAKAAQQSQSVIDAYEKILAKLSS